MRQVSHSLTSLAYVSLLPVLLCTHALAEPTSLPPMTDLPAMSQGSAPSVPISTTVTSQTAPNEDNYLKRQGSKIYRWRDDTQYILVHIQEPLMGMPDWDPQNIQAVKNAFAQWQQATQNRFKFLYMPDNRVYDVLVSWQAYPMKNQHEEASGINHTQTWSKYLLKNDIELSLHNMQGERYYPAGIESTALHEIGHMLGIKEHSDNPEDIMYPSHVLAPWMPPRRLTQRDINTLNLIYQQKASYTNPPKTHLSNAEAYRKAHPGGYRVMVLFVGFIPIPIPIPNF